MAQKYTTLEVLFDYDQPREGQLELKKGQQLRSLEMLKNGWLMAMNLGTWLLKKKRQKFLRDHLPCCLQRLN